MTAETDRLRIELDKLRVDYETLKERVVESDAHKLVMDEKVSTLIKFVDRLATVVYTSAGGLFITIVGSAILTKGA